MSAGPQLPGSLPAARAPTGAIRGTALLLRLRLRRIWNRFCAVSLGGKRAGRSGTAGKSHRGLLLSFVVGGLLLFSYANLGWVAVSNLDRNLGTWERSQPSPPGLAAPPDFGWSREPLPRAPGKVLPEGVLRGATLVLSLLFVAVLLVTLANRELSRPEWDLEWLVTLPLPLESLLRMRMIERTVLNLFGLFALLPFTWALAWRCGFRLASVPVGVLGAYALLGMVAVLETAFEGALRLSFPPNRLRNFQALSYLVGLPVLYLAISVGVGAGQEPGYFLYDWARGFPDFTRWLPTGLIVQALASRSWPDAVPCWLILGAELLVVAIAGTAFLVSRLRLGLVAHGTRESGGRGGRRPVASRLPEPAAPSSAAEPLAAEAVLPVPAPQGARETWMLSGIQRKELKLLSRDRAFLVQSLILPVFICGLQVFINPGVLQGAFSAPRHLGAFAFGITAYVMMFSSFQVLNAEGPALWILYTVPHPLERLITQKAMLWGVLALAYPLLILGLGGYMAGGVSLDTLGIFALVLLGVPLYSVIAACLGVLGSRPLDPDVQRSVRPQQAYLYMLLASLYAFAIYAEQPWQRFCLIVLTALLAFALWQKARDQLPYLLDPVAVPPPRTSLADGLIAAQLFFVLQALAAIVCLVHLQLPPVVSVAVAFGAAGAVTFGLVRLVYWRKKVALVPRFADPSPGRAVRLGAVGGTAAAAMAAAYLYVARWGGFIDAVPSDPVLLGGKISDPGIVILTVVLAPIFEEFIFRGLVFGGLRRSLGFWPAALASAVIFSMVHPPTAVVPVFALGICAALVFERSGYLLAPVVAHAVYNALLLAIPAVGLP